MTTFSGEYWAVDNKAKVVDIIDQGLSKSVPLKIVAKTGSKQQTVWIRTESRARESAVCVTKQGQKFRADLTDPLIVPISFLAIKE